MSGLGGNVVPISSPALVDASVVAFHIGYKRSTVVYLARKGKIPAISVTNGIRKHWRFDLAAVLRKLEVA